MVAITLLRDKKESSGGWRLDVIHLDRKGQMIDEFGNSMGDKYMGEDDNVSFKLLVSWICAFLG